MSNTNVVSVNQSLDFNSIYNQYYKEIVSFVSFKVNSNDIAEELTNDSFMKFYKNLESFNPEKSKLRTWLFTIVNNTVIDYYRSVKKENNKTSIDSNSIEGKRVFEINDSSNNILDVLNNNDIKVNVLKAIDNIKNIELKKIANLYFIEDLSYNEISDSLNMPLGSVKGYISRVRIELQKELRKKEVYI
jgi:RNA polymerase sigma-70 factor (ECF subfamily)